MGLLGGAWCVLRLLLLPRAQLVLENLGPRHGASRGCLGSASTIGRSCLVRSTPWPQHAMTSTSGSAARSASHGTRTEYSPSGESTGVPWASRINSGFQCPEL